MKSPHGRSAGVLLPAFSPRRLDDLGIGDTRSFRDWIDWAADHQVGFLQLLPIQETGDDNSPYNAISSIALEPVYLSCDPVDLPGITADEVADVRFSMGAALHDRLVDYPTVRRSKRALLEIAWPRFTEAESHLKEEFESFRKAEATWLSDYCVYRWLMEQNGGRETWDLWSDDCNTPEKARVLLAREQAAHPGEVEERLSFFAWVQWLCFRQWRSVRKHADVRGVKLMGDIPIGVSWYSADVFFCQEDFDLGWCGGAPPELMFKYDPFIRKWGQNWGIPLYRWDKMEAEGFPWWRQRISKLTEIFHIFRIDHILGFYRIYAFPWRPQRNAEFLDLTPDEAAEKTAGLLPRWAWRPDDTPENMAANCDEGDRRLKMVIEAAGGAEIVGEDLGCVPEYVRPHLELLGIAGFRIPHWDFDDEGHVVPPSELPECSFATYATHDHDTLAGMWNAFRADISNPDSDPDEVRKAEGNLRLLAEFAGIPAHGSWPVYSDVHQWRLIKSLLASRSRYAALLITDLTGLSDRYNLPGTVGGENWRLRLPWAPTGALANAAFDAASDKLAMQIALSGRSLT